MAKRKRAIEYPDLKDLNIQVPAIPYTNDRDGLLKRLHDSLRIILSRKLTQSAMEYSYIKWLGEYEQKYQSTGNAIYLIRAFLESVRFGRRVPDWVLDGLYEGLRNYYDGVGDITLDKAFGLKEMARGGYASAFTKYLKAEMNEMFFERVQRAINRRHTVTEAIDIANNYTTKRIKEVIPEFEDLDYDTAKKKYYKLKKIDHKKKA